MLALLAGYVRPVLDFAFNTPKCMLILSVSHEKLE
ncbi:hypothetical protein SAMN02745866_04192 [Alteromonadaceae bacterium Bs31]|nr:hypothetical protein SAMN02745866_04192 [Alteromonadaceae bacterium Bs31]